MPGPSTCHEFERLWHDRLDHAARPHLPHDGLDDHAAACDACRALHAQYQLLERALALPWPAVDVPEGFADRVLAAAERPVVSIAPAAWRRHAVVLATAAVVAIAATVAITQWAARPHAPAVVNVPRPAAPTEPNSAAREEPIDLTATLSEATSTTLSLAWQASAPAARVGREILGRGGFEAAPSARGLPEGVAMVPASEMLQEVGERVNAGVRPFSGTARSAFGFLLGPAGDDDNPAEPGGQPAPAPGRNVANPPRGA